MPLILKQLFQAITDGARSAGSRDMSLQLATAALLIEMMRADQDVALAEEDTLRQALRQEFELDDDALEALIVQAEREARDAPGYFAFTKAINDTLPVEDKVRIMEYLWRIALADGVLAAHENHLMRKLADLIHIGHGDYHAAKERARTHLDQR